MAFTQPHGVFHETDCIYRRYHWNTQLAPKQNHILQTNLSLMECNFIQWLGLNLRISIAFMTMDLETQQ
jgi:hypothetical protein